MIADLALADLVRELVPRVPADHRRPPDGVDLRGKPLLALGISTSRPAASPRSPRSARAYPGRALLSIVGGRRSGSLNEFSPDVASVVKTAPHAAHKEIASRRRERRPAARTSRNGTSRASSLRHLTCGNTTGVGAGAATRAAADGPRAHHSGRFRRADARSIRRRPCRACPAGPGSASGPRRSTFDKTRRSRSAAAPRRRRRCFHPELFAPGAAWRRRTYGRSRRGAVVCCKRQRSIDSRRADDDAHMGKAHFRSR